MGHDCLRVIDDMRRKSSRRIIISIIRRLSPSLEIGTVDVIESLNRPKPGIQTIPAMVSVSRTMSPSITRTGGRKQEQRM